VPVSRLTWDSGSAARLFPFDDRERTLEDVLGFLVSVEPLGYLVDGGGADDLRRRDHPVI